jgi:acyl carrier protein
LAAVEGLRKEAPSGDLDRAAAWSQANFERTLSLLQSDSPLESGAGDTGISASVAAYSRAIGDAEPLLMWDEQSFRPSHSPESAEGGGQPPSSRRSGMAEARQRSSSGASESPRRASVKPGRALRSWIVTWLAQRLRVAESQIDPRRSFADHGMDSLAAVELAKALSDHLGRSLDETLLWNFANIDALLQYLEAPPTPTTRPSATPAAAAPKPAAKSTEADLEDELARLEKELSRRS